MVKSTDPPGLNQGAGSLCASKFILQVLLTSRPLVRGSSLKAFRKLFMNVHSENDHRAEVNVLNLNLPLLANLQGYLLFPSFSPCYP